MRNNKVEICGVNTSKLPVLTAKEKRELFEKIKQGDAEARQKFIYGNLRLVLSILITEMKILTTFFKSAVSD